MSTVTVGDWSIINNVILTSNHLMIDLRYVYRVVRDDDSNVVLYYSGLSPNSATRQVISVRKKHRDELFDAIVLAKSTLPVNSNTDTGVVR
ncbi:hypothetical protein NVP1031O_062 [Vibrio phage 1.031.O._10N.261.46.F8]|nr:hypothetical protein NVP1031O_062 [Vibrio phage 1.031.O._10N.261.46.F8]